MLKLLTIPQKKRVWAIPIALAIAVTASGEQGITIALLIALACLVQIQSAAGSVRISDTVFGPRAKRLEPVGEATAGSPPATKAVALAPAAAPTPAPNIQKILYATDMSRTARHAARYACSLGHRFGAEVHVIHVIQDALDAMSTEAGISFADMIEHADWEAFQEEGIEKAKRAINRRIQESSRDVKREIPLCPLSKERVFVEVGDPVQTVLSVAEKGGFDLIVLGTNGHGRLKSSVLGSVAGEIVKKSRIPVMVVRLPEEGPPDARS